VKRQQPRSAEDVLLGVDVSSVRDGKIAETLTSMTP